MVNRITGVEAVQNYGQYLHYGGMKPSGVFLPQGKKTKKLVEKMQKSIVY